MRGADMLLASTNEHFSVKMKTNQTTFRLLEYHGDVYYSVLVSVQV